MQKYLVALALVAILLVSVNAQDYDDEGANQGGNDGFGGFSGSSSDDDYAAPRERGVIGAEGSDNQPQSEDAGNEPNDGYDGDDVAAAASHAHPTMSRANLVKLIKQSR